MAVMFIVVETRWLIERCTGLNEDLTKIRSVADYQFGKDVGAKLFPDNVQIAYSQNTGRIRYIYLDGKRLATMRPTDGLFSLSLDGAKRIAEAKGSPRCFVTVKSDVAQFVADGGDVFAAHIVDADEDVRAKDEVIVVAEDGRVLAVGRAVLSAGEMKAFKRGAAVKVRRGDAEES
jgi:predicted RNA-binding protein (TIGR00451 family)